MNLIIGFVTFVTYSPNFELCEEEELASLSSRRGLKMKQHIAATRLILYLCYGRQFSVD